MEAAATDANPNSRRNSASQKTAGSVVSPSKTSEGTSSLSPPVDSPRSQRARGSSPVAADTEGSCQARESEGTEPTGPPSPSKDAVRDQQRSRASGVSAVRRAATPGSVSEEPHGEAGRQRERKSEEASASDAQEQPVAEDEEIGEQEDGRDSLSQPEGGSAGDVLVPGTMAANIPRVRGKQAWREKGAVRSFGRFCREAANRAKGSWETQKQARNEQRAMRQAEREMREERAAVLRRRREKTEEKKRRKEENELKSSQVQVIKNTSKLRKWGKKARRDLVKMSPEMIQKLYNVRV
ncbi:conserved hypothetical protein [Neospora caninum Liverpool]|uniref:Coiled-coil domain-containing protein 86 n=1 Tax=Neospora caninum (strain Liverpool) TaxID=572307 RepID=F0VK68_NEOCL|nr:conserved hypothetical protein [Neospora caninum Liverpool]CBZ54469.1 conserved hypothetical protein [Neospora caninum Liverpool]CEL69181.1 TPA: hypothetical protein BN1204_048980 [Neospora caninum Liverpool]|eukprot:XP_003884499.1 conserved hypothetical protein [Neospora caninum Liverpool]